MEQRLNVLIVDDEMDMRHLIQMYLENAGFVCDHASNSSEVYEIIRKKSFDLLLLDIMLPGENGFEILQTLRSKYKIPIIFLSAKGEEWDKVKGLDLGADDYIVKPFSPGELVARIHAVLRRSGSSEDKLSILKSGVITINTGARKVLVSGIAVTLTLKEYEMLVYFVNHKGQVVSREQLLEHVWGFDYQGSLRTVDTHVKTLRMKLGAADYISTVWGIGYKYEVRTNDEAETEFFS